MSQSMAKAITEGKFWAEMRRVASRWWPWLLILIGITVMITESIRKDEVAGAITLIVWGTSLGLLRLMFAFVDRKKPRAARTKLKAFAGWLPWILLLLGISVLIVESMHYRDEGIAVAIVIMLTGCVILGIRGVKSLFGERGSKA